MQKGTTLFYHNHITTNLTNVDKRTQGYIKHRKQFLRKYCQPLNQKILKLDKQIDFYNHLIENQNEMIENEVQVAELKREIGQFLVTQDYFLSHLEQYQERIVHLAVENKVMEGKIRRIKSDIVGITKKKAQQAYNQLSIERDNKSIRTVLSHSKVSNSKSNRLSQSNSNNHNHQGILLPTIFKIEKYYVNKQTQKINKQLNNGVKNRQQNSFTVDVNVGGGSCDNATKSTKVMQDQLVSMSINKKNNKKTVESTSKQIINTLPINSKPQLQQLQHNIQQQPTPINIKLRLKQLLTTFNKFQLLFKQCFDKKKTHVQKSVRQLQSKLISNRQRFLSICQAISQKNINKVPFQVFSAMSGDQIMTLIISYPWLQKRLFKELTDRKKLFIDIQVGNNGKMF